MSNTNNTSKKHESFKQTYQKGVFWHDRDKVSKLVSDTENWIEMINAGANDDGTEFITIKINNIKPK